MPEPRGHTLFTETLGIVNEALEAHRDEAPWKGLLDRAGPRLEGLDLGVAIHENADPAPIDHYTVRMEDGKLAVTSRGERPATVDWRVSVDELRAIVDDRDAYIADPARLDLDWLRRRIDGV